MEEDREQPFEEPANVSIETSEDSAASGDGSLKQGQTVLDNEQDGESLGKFKTVQALLTAYNNLQSEFTKKCQLLSQLEKDKSHEDNKLSDEQIDEKLQDFLSHHLEAKDYATEIKNKIEGSSEISSSSLENAWSSVILDHIKAENDEDKLLDKYVLSDENVKNKVIQSYLNSLSKLEMPTVISSNQGQRVSGVVSGTPSSLNEARSLLEKMFE